MWKCRWRGAEDDKKTKGRWRVVEWERGKKGKIVGITREYHGVNDFRR